MHTFIYIKKTREFKKFDFDDENDSIRIPRKKHEDKEQKELICLQRAKIAI
jgi:hypothetical protein